MEAYAVFERVESVVYTCQFQNLFFIVALLQLGLVPVNGCAGAASSVSTFAQPLFEQLHLGL